MLPFQDITLETEKELRNCFRYQSARTCDYTVGTSYQWREIYQSQTAVIGKLVFSRAVFMDEGLCYIMPIGEGNMMEALSLIEQDARERGCELKFCIFSQNDLSDLKEYFGERVETVEAKRDWFDYLYDITQLQTFSGKKMHGQKNHWNRFKKEHPEYRYERITMDNLEEAEGFLQKYGKTAELNGDIEVRELMSAQDLLKHIFDLDLKGGIIWTEKGIVALSIGEVQGDTLYIHVEKAFANITGAFQTIVAEFAKDAAEESTLYCNREDDAGDMGLRKSKTDYHPIGFVEKYCVHVR